MTKYNFPVHLKGNTFKARQITFGYDLTGARIDLQFKERAGGQIVFSFSTADNTITYVNSTTGVVRLNEFILDVAANTYVYDCQIIDANGSVVTLFYGQMQITQDVTQVV